MARNWHRAAWCFLCATALISGATWGLGGDIFCFGSSYKSIPSWLALTTGIAAAGCGTMSLFEEVGREKHLEAKVKNFGDREINYDDLSR